MTFSEFGNLKTPVVLRQTAAEEELIYLISYDYFTSIKALDRGRVEVHSTMSLDVAIDRDSPNLVTLNFKEMDYIYNPSYKSDKQGIEESEGIAPQPAKRRIIKDMFS